MPGLSQIQGRGSILGAYRSRLSAQVGVLVMAKTAADLASHLWEHGGGRAERGARKAERGTVLIILDAGRHDVYIRDDDGDWIYEDDVRLDEDKTIWVEC